MKAVSLLSGGMDSTTLAYHLADRGMDLHLVHIMYGQRHGREGEFALQTARKLEADFSRVDLRGLQPHLRGSALTDDVEVPEGHYAHENMKVTVVPNRNAIMLSVAFGIAAAEGANVVGAAMHAGDHDIYPDCRPSFAVAFEAAMEQALSGDIYGNPPPELEAPFITKTKADIVEIGHALGVPWDETWTCYKGEKFHCGRCSTCVERLEAFDLAGVTDPTFYKDREYWKEAVEDFESSQVQ